MDNKITTKTKKQNALQIWSMITVWGVVIYVAIDIALAFLRPDYSLLHNAESDYGRGPYFWLMDINFILRCLLSLTLVKALLNNFPKNNPITRAGFWLGLWAVASGLLAFFTDNPYGYPKLQSGPIHLLLGFVAFIGVMIAMVLFSRLATAMKLSRVAAYSQVTLTVIAFLSLFLMGHAGIRPHSLGGLYERIFLGSVLLWEVILALSIRTDRNIGKKPSNRLLQQ
jgi:hypothetical membrane protein